MNKKFSDTASFTLVELLVVIGILAILTAAVVIILNPAELLRQARDSNRMTDLATIDKAISLLLTQQPDTNLGTAQTVYVSLPDTSATCANHTLPTLPTGYQYACVTEANLQNIDGTGWIPVDFTTTPIQSLPVLPVDPNNTATNYYTYTMGGSWHLLTLLESNKHRVDAATDGGLSPAAYETGSNLTLYPPTFPAYWIRVPGDSTHGTSDFYVMQYEAKNVSGIPTSQPALTPWVSISQTNAIAECTSIDAHLITNAQWQTIAHNIQQQPQNWSGGSVGSGSIHRGNSNTSAAMDGTDPLSGTNKRTHILSTGAEIWDIAGNVWDWNADTIVGTDKPVGGGSSWVEWTTVLDYGSLDTEDVKPFNTTWNSSQGIGRYYQGNADGTTYAFLRGGGWSYGTYAGVETLLLGNTPSAAHGSFGFRCAR